MDKSISINEIDDIEIEKLDAADMHVVAGGNSCPATGSTRSQCHIDGKNDSDPCGG